MRIDSSFMDLVTPAVMSLGIVAGALVGQNGHMDWDNGWWIWMPIMMILVWGGIIAVVVWAVRTSTGGSRSERATPLDIARERLARGEISEEEFERIRQKL